MAGRGGKLLQMLRGLDQHELQAVRREFDWCQIDSYDGKKSYTKRLRDAVDRSVEAGDITYEQFMTELRDEALLSRGYKTKTQIKRVLENVQLTASPIGKERKNEEWYSAQVYGALQNELEEEYSVYLEYEFDNYAHERVDLFIKSTEKDEKYLIESKRVSSINGIAKVRGQLERYHDTIESRNRTFLFVVDRVKDEEYGSINKADTACSNQSAKTLEKLENLEDELPQTTVITRHLMPNI